MTRTVRVDLLSGRVVRDTTGRRIGRIHDLIAEVAHPGSGEYVVRQIHLSTGGLVERLGGTHFARILAERFGVESNRLVVDWRDIDLSDPERPTLRRPLERQAAVSRARSSRAGAGRRGSG